MNFRLYRGNGLTSKQRELYEWLRTLDEVPRLKVIATHFKESDAAVHGRLQRLVKKKYLIRQPKYKVKDPTTE